MKRILSVLCACGLALCLAASANEAPAGMTIELTGLKNQEGKIKVAVFSQAEGFPGDHTKAVYASTFPIDDLDRLRVEVGDLPKGKYAVVAYHDEDDNGKLTKNMFGAPKEGVGFSNGARATFGPPKFEDCLVASEEGPLEIKLSY